MENNNNLIKELEYQLQEMKNKLSAKELIINNLLEELLKEAEIKDDTY